jgi:type IV pilus assembly protein PilE
MYRARKAAGRNGIKTKCIRSGFSLIEILITLSIIGILAMVSVPTYTHYLVSAHRAQATAILTQLSTALEQYHIEHNAYADADIKQLPVNVAAARKSYQFTLTQADGDDYTLSATPVGAQANQDKDCGTLSIDANGERHISGSGDIDACWG